MNVLDDKNNTPLDLMLPSNMASSSGSHLRRKLPTNTISEVVQSFVCNGYNPNATIRGKSLLHFACRLGDVKLMIKLKADISTRDRGLLHAAASFGKVDAVLYLINKFGFDPNTVGADGYTPLHIASLKGYDSLVQVLLKSASQISLVTLLFILPQKLTNLPVLNLW